MTTFSDLIRLGRLVDSPEVRVEGAEPRVLVALDPSILSVELAANASAQLVLIHSKTNSATIDLRLGDGAILEVAQIFTDETFSELTIAQSTDSQCTITSIELSSANSQYTINLNGHGAKNQFNGLFFAANKEHCVAHLRTNHNAPNCSSDSFFKGVAGGSSLGEFRGMVYVAPLAQRTDARQQSRNILLSPSARITAQPQLEIYADDVKCSHGATVGQMDSEAILYMRQRGLSELQARQLQIEGFVGDIIRRCSIAQFVDEVLPLANKKMENL